MDSQSGGGMFPEPGWIQVCAVLLSSAERDPLCHVWERGRQLTITKSMIFQEIWAQMRQAEIDDGQ